MSEEWSDSRQLPWLPKIEDWSGRLQAAKHATTPWSEFAALANCTMDFVQCDRLDKAIIAQRQAFSEGAPTPSIRLAVMASSTMAHLLPALRIAGFRWGLPMETYLCGYGQYFQETLDATSPLYAFSPNVVLFCIDSRTIVQGAETANAKSDSDGIVETVLDSLRTCWQRTLQAFRCQIIQQTALPIFPPIMGSNEHRAAHSPAALIDQFNKRLREEAERYSVDLLALDSRAAIDGLHSWYDPVLWHRAKQEISLSAAPLYGDCVVRLIAAKRGKSRKCLVLDLDNTLWGGVIGDDGLEGITLGQGSALGEAFLSFQHYARQLASRGVILAVCSKNDEKNAREAFERHPEMALRLDDISCFVANWDDKARNIRTIAQRLNIGLDAIVFLDDNPFERNLVRAELPMVAVPEIPDDPSLFAGILSDSGYFESLSLTDEDRNRTQLYKSNAEREALAATSTDLTSYLKSLDMTLVWKRFDRTAQQRIVQLINKTNQFNLTTKRYSDEDFLAVLGDSKAFGLQLRLIDRFGDNGIIAIVIGRLVDDADVLIDTWLMSCRVLGRQVEEATLDLVVSEAKKLGAARIIGEYRPTAKNQMVEGLYARLGFGPLEPRDGVNRLEELVLSNYTPVKTFIKIREDQS